MPEARRGQACLSPPRCRLRGLPCHPAFTDLLVHDIGTGGGPGELLGPAFDTPSLRGPLAYRAVSPRWAGADPARGLGRPTTPNDTHGHTAHLSEGGGARLGGLSALCGRGPRVGSKTWSGWSKERIKPMHKLRTILRPLILIVLSGWLGAAAQPAEAQQNRHSVRPGHRLCRPSRSRYVRFSGTLAGIHLDRRTGNGQQWRLSPLGVAREIPHEDTASTWPPHFPTARTDTLDEYHPELCLRDRGDAVGTRDRFHRRALCPGRGCPSIPVIIRRSVLARQTPLATTAWGCL